MGWVSMIEDNIEAIASDFERVKSTLNAASLGYDASLHLESLVKTCEILLRNLSGCLELALSPNLDIANELIEAKRQNAALIKSMHGIREENQALSQELIEVKKEKKLLVNQLRGLIASQESNGAANRSDNTKCEICSVTVKASRYESHKKKVHGQTVDRFWGQSGVRISTAGSNKTMAKIETPSFNNIRIIPLKVKK